MLAALLAARFTPGKNPVMHHVTMVAISPTLPVLWAVGAFGLWPFSEKADLAFAVLLGGLTLLTSFLYAIVLLAGTNLIGKLKRSA